MDCIFCRLVRKEAPADIVYENDQVLAFHDIKKDAPEHILIVPKKHLASLNDLTAADDPLVAALWSAAREIAARRGLTEKGYRLIVNAGRDGGQVVPHLHLHLLGGAPLGPLVAKRPVT